MICTYTFLLYSPNAFDTVEFVHYDIHKNIKKSVHNKTLYIITSNMYLHIDLFSPNAFDTVESVHYDVHQNINKSVHNNTQYRL